MEEKAEIKQEVAQLEQALEMQPTASEEELKAEDSPFEVVDASTQAEKAKEKE